MLSPTVMPFLIVFDNSPEPVPFHDDYLIKTQNEILLCIRLLTVFCFERSIAVADIDSIVPIFAHEVSPCKFS